MEKLHYSVTINAPVQKVWSTMLDDATYREWTDVFNPSSGSYYVGDWSEGSTMKFLGPEENGTVSGMYARIKENRPLEFLSIQHLGEIIKGEQQPFRGIPEGAEVHENYTFTEVEGGTRVDVDLDTNEEFKAMFEEMWPKALVVLKELAEK